jgi:hypothetical protein
VALAQLEVIEGLEVELGPLADLPEGDVVLLGVTIRRVRVRQVGQRDQDLLAALVEFIELGLELLELRLQRARPLAQLGELGVSRLAGLGRLLDLRGQLVLIRPDRVGSRVELAPALVGAEELIDTFGRPPARQS